MERIKKTLENLGFTQADVRVYVYLAKVGPQNGKELSEELQMTERQTSAVLKNLLEKGAVTCTVAQPVSFSALAFEELLDLFVKASVDQAKNIRKSKEVLLASWQEATRNLNN